MASVNPNIATVVDSPEYWIHRYEEAQDAFRFIPVSRQMHRNLTFVTDEHLPDDLEHISFPRRELSALTPRAAPLHFIFHSAYCCSTMLARAFDIEGASMGLKEPQILNDMVGWKRRGAPPRGVAAVTDQALKLLARPFGDGETVIVKPSNLVNSLAMMMLAMYPNAKAVLLYAPIESFLISIAKKEMWGRKWVRELLAGIRQDGYLVGGLNSDELLQLTDLQIAALGWLSQHSLFAHIANKLGSERIKVLDSKTLLGNQHQAIQALTQHFDIALSPGQLTDILKGPAFNSHSKFGQKSDSATFNAVDREKEQSAMADLHGEEIKMVADWTRAVAASQNIKMDFGSKILG